MDNVTIFALLVLAPRSLRVLAAVSVGIDLRSPLVPAPARVRTPAGDGDAARAFRPP